MSDSIDLASGGSLGALTTTEAVFDLTNLQGCDVLIWCDDQDIWFSGTSVSTGGTLVTSGTQAADLNALVADRIGKGTQKKRRVGHEPFLVAKTTTGTGTLRVKVVEKP